MPLMYVLSHLANNPTDSTECLGSECTTIRKYGSTSNVMMKWFQNNILYLTYSSDFARTQAECCKAFTQEPFSTVL